MTAAEMTLAEPAEPTLFAQALVWAEIPVSDLDAGIAFYTAVTGGALDRMTMGPDETAIIRTDPPMSGSSAHLYVGKPAGDGTGPTVHLSVAGTVEQALERAKAAGATIVRGEPVSIPEGRFVYISDPDGNSIGLFQPTTGPGAA